MKILSTFLLTFTLITGFSQEYQYIGGKKYKVSSDSTLIDQSIYLKFGAGVNFIALESTINYENRSYEDYSIVTNPYSTGRGFQFNLALGFKLGKNIALELGGAHLRGQKQGIGYFYTGNNFYEIDNVEQNVNMTSISSSLKFDFAKAGNFTFYTKLGAMVGFAKREVKSNYFYYQFDRQYDEKGVFTWEDTGGFGFGFNGSLGFETKLSDNVSFYTELYYQNINIGYEKGTRKTQVVNGQSVMPYLNKSQKEWVYVDELNYQDTQNPDEPGKSLRAKDFMGTIGLHFGLLINL